MCIRDSRSTALYDFCCGIIDATADLVCAFKPQIAYFASCGAEAEDVYKRQGMARSRS